MINGLVTSLTLDCAARKMLTSKGAQAPRKWGLITVKSAKIMMTAFGFALCAAAPAHAAVIFKSTQIVSAAAANTNVKSVFTSQSKSVTAKRRGSLPVGALTATSTASAIGKVGSTTAITALASGTGTANFASAAAGTFDAVSNDSIVQSIASTRTTPILSTTASSAYTFIYQFTNTTRSKLTLNYALFDPNAYTNSLVTAKLAGLGGFTDKLAPGSSGSISTYIFAGDYALTLGSTYMDRVSRNGLGIGTTSGLSNDHFSFSISGVPEPTTWMMMILGFGGIGGAMRSRRTRQAASFA